MKYNLKKPIKELEILSQVVDFPRLELPIYRRVRRWLKVYKFDNDFDSISFEKFMIVAKYAGQLQYVTRFMKEVTNVNISKFPIYKIMGLYYHYENEYKKCIDFFTEQKDLVVSKEVKTLYDFEEFGLTQIIRFLSEGDRVKYETYLKASVYAVMADYRFKIKQVENHNYATQQQTP